MWWDLDLSGDARQTSFTIGAVDVATNETLHNLSSVADDTAVSSLVVDPRLVAGRVVRFFVAPLVGYTTFPSSVMSRPVTIARKDFSAVRLNRTSILSHDGDALVELNATPHGATHGNWSSKLHVGVMRSLFVRSIGLVRIPRLGQGLMTTRSRGLLQAVSACVNSGNVMRLVLRFATPFCTATEEERGDV